jgi:hypothetical protein
LAYDALPIQSISKSFANNPLNGYVLLRGSGALVIEECLNGPNGVGRCIRFRLDTANYPTALSDFTGPCGHVPESGDTQYQPIYYINTATPDVNGNIDLTLVEPMYLRNIEYGIAIDTPYSQTAVSDAQNAARYPSPDGKLPGTGKDVCS